MDERYSTQSLLVLRKLTRAMAEAIRARVGEHVKTVSPLLRAESVLGSHIQGGHHEFVRKADQAFKELQAMYDAIAPTAPFNLRHELTPPLTLANLPLELTAVDYVHDARAGTDARRLLVRSPLTWILHYQGFAPHRFGELMNPKLRADDAQRFILAYLTLHLAFKYQPGIAALFEALHFPVTATTIPTLGALPIMQIGMSVRTERPPDEVMLQTAELTGVDAFEEVVRLDDVDGLRDPLKEELLQIVENGGLAVAAQ